MRTSLWLYPVELAFTFVLSVAPAFGKEYFVRAVVTDGRVYVSPLANMHAREPGWMEAGGYFTLLGQDLSDRNAVITLRLPVAVEPDPAQPVLHRWQVAGKRVHFVRYARPFDYGVLVPHYMREGHIVSWPLDTVAKFTAPVRETLADPARFRELEGSIRTEEAGPPRWQIPLQGRIKSWEKDWVSFDFLPAADGRYEWYLSVPDGKRNRVSRTDSRPPAKKGDKSSWTEVGSWPIEAGSAIFATAAGEDRFLVTESGGHVFAVPRRPKAGAQLKEIWKDKPVDALIHDADNGKWYAFTKDQYFEVADAIKPKAHNLDIQRAKTAEDALKTGVKCGRVIRGLPEPKGK